MMMIMNVCRQLLQRLFPNFVQLTQQVHSDSTSDDYDHFHEYNDDDNDDDDNDDNEYDDDDDVGAN